MIVSRLQCLGLPTTDKRNRATAALFVEIAWTGIPPEHTENGRMLALVACDPCRRGQKLSPEAPPAWGRIAVSPSIMPATGQQALQV